MTSSPLESVKKNSGTIPLPLPLSPLLINVKVLVHGGQRSGGQHTVNKQSDIPSYGKMRNDYFLCF